DSFFAGFALGLVRTNGVGLRSYPIDNVHKTMMMTSGKTVKYKSSMDALSRIIKNEGAKSLFNCASANILRAIAFDTLGNTNDGEQVRISHWKQRSGSSHDTSSASISNEKKEMSEVVVQGQWFMSCDSVVAVQRV
nr:ADP,ATP carrier protein 1, mitochondrial-like [Tanacetum cinerariifolium]